MVPSMYNPGGMERILTEKLNILAEKYNYNIIIVTTDQNSKPFYFELSKKITIVNFDLNFNEDFNSNYYIKFIETKKKIKKYKILLLDLLKIHKIDICISTGGKELEFFQSLNVSCKKILEIHFAKSFRKQFLLARNSSLISKMIGNFRNWQLIRQTQKLDKVVVLTKNDEAEWKKTHNNVVQIYNFTTISSDKSIDYNNKVVIAVGRLDAQKGFDLLLDAWILAKSKMELWQLHIYGQGEWQDMLTEKIKENQLQKNVFLKGVTTNIKSKFEESSIFAFTSRYEGFGLVLAEAMSLGLPAIAFNCKQGPSEILSKKSGFLVDLYDVRKFSEYLVLLSQNNELRQKMGEEAKKVSLKFSQYEIMSQWDLLLKEIVYYENTN